ncbi:bifunctional diguanylate cyclase/phosphodiesterase [Microlunatus sp. Gsoil 973]|uniref:putative bifunctional diguanylate cyclase/phosphodiesterase n=1 Tax=Microlunatus sp. Gsoil 973 TaxID=2672569 RepID=UPI0012B479F9|nr:EAL domain-containing protein [Microlunatus sp. Gsoil 973]QGN34325.1 EAL domain-containing protein [Microlunatus sp. Gsoil 973]
MTLPTRRLATRAPGSARTKQGAARDRRSRRLWFSYLLLSALMLLGFELIRDKAVSDAVYQVIGLIGVAAIVVGVRLHRPSPRLPWYLMAVGQFLLLLGDGIYSWLEDVSHQVPYPSWADASYLSAYPVLAVALIWLVRARRIRWDVALLDSSIVTAGLGLLCWVVLLQPTIKSPHESALSAAVAAAYPIADLLLLAGLVLLLVTPGGRTNSMRLLLGALALLIVADSLYLGLNLFGSGQSDSVDFLWLASYLLWGAAALHPSIAPTSSPTPEVDLPLRHTRLAAMTVAVLIAPGILGVQQLTGSRIDVGAVAIGSVVILGLVMARMRVGIGQITAANSQLELLRDELAFQAAHDPLTGLPNRPEAMRLIHAALSRAQRSGDLLALLFIDLDGFKAVNDAHGHHAGDEVLREVARRVRDEIRAGDTAARLGGDEFVVLVSPIESVTSASEVARRVVSAISQPISITGGEANVGASIGIALNHDLLTDADALLHEADTAAYRAKANGRGRIELFATALDRQADLEDAIAHAIGHDELIVHYQPIIDVATGRVAGCEALLRWNRSGVGMVLPSQFIPVAESSDLICDLDTWVLYQATQVLSEWSRVEELSDLFITVNISGRHINTPRIQADVADALAAHQVEPGRLVLEFTETVLIDEQLALGNLDALRKLGVGLALDDFGTGYSSIAQLTRLPIDRVKIDRSFLNSSSPSARRLLQLMIYAAQSSGLGIVAEGVELPEQLAFLETLGVEHAQGHLFGAAVPRGQLETRLIHQPADETSGP